MDRELQLAEKIASHDGKENERVGRYDFAAKAEVAAFVKVREKLLRGEIDQLRALFHECFEKEETFDDLVASNIEMMVERLKELEMSGWQKFTRWFSGMFGSPTAPIPAIVPALPELEDEDEPVAEEGVNQPYGITDLPVYTTKLITANPDE